MHNTVCCDRCISYANTVSAAEAERGFSVMKETIIPKRAVVSNECVSNQLIIMLSGDEMDRFDFDRVIDKWFRFTKCRRVTT